MANPLHNLLVHKPLTVNTGGQTYVYHKKNILTLTVIFILPLIAVVCNLDIDDMFTKDPDPEYIKGVIFAEDVSADRALGIL